MRIFEDNKKGIGKNSPPACSYCRHEGHNINECPHAQEDWDNGWHELRVPIHTTNINASWMKSPRYWGEWFTKCKETLAKQAAYKLKQEAKENGKGKSKPRRAALCGFCGEAGHTRRNCLAKQTFLDDAYQANRNWRKAAYRHLVTERGLSAGAVVQVYDMEGHPKIGTITDINFDTISLFSSSDRHKWGDLSSPLYISVLVDGEKCPLTETIGSSHWKRVNKGTITGNTDIEYAPFHDEQSGRHYGTNYCFIKTLSRAENELGEEWVNGYKDGFDFLAKKWNHEKLLAKGVYTLIEKWKNMSE